MTSQTFARARSEEQRAARRAAVLAAATQMLADGDRVAELTLNELARKVGLAKSNVLRYFETREAVLLELLAIEFQAWLGDVAAGLESAAGEPVERVAGTLSTTLAARPMLAELLSNASGVLEHNVSLEIAARYKHRMVEQSAALVALIEPVVGPLTPASRTALAGAIILIAGGAWSMCRPSPGMAAAYERYPDLAAMRLDYRVAVREFIATVMTGVLARPVADLTWGTWCALSVPSER